MAPTLVFSIEYDLDMAFLQKYEEKKWFEGPRGSLKTLCEPIDKRKINFVYKLSQTVLFQFNSA